MTKRKLSSRITQAKDDLKKKLPAETSSFLKSAHWMIDKMFRLRGYEFEIRENGEFKLGLWRKKWRRAGSRGSTPKRLVLLPGFGDTPLSWLIVLTFLSPVLRLKFDEIIMLDFPGFAGFLSKEKAFTGIDRMLEAVFSAFADLQPHTVLGHSLGGYLAARYAIDGQDEIYSNAAHTDYRGPAKVILVNPSGLFHKEEERKVFESRFKMATKEGFHHLRPHLFASEPAWFKLMIDEFNDFIFRPDIGAFVHSMGSDHLLMGKFSKVTCEVCLIWGEKDGIISVENVPVWLEQLSHSKASISAHAVILKKLGHSPQVENPVVTATILGQILSDKSPRPKSARWWTVVET
jgi:pimeloyl-ACP methyl ester carboxylesterase